MNTSGRTIQIYLPTGEPRGIRLAQMANRVVQAMVFPRHRLADAAVRQETEGVSVYFLFGQRQDEERRSVYVGEAEEFIVRVKQHHVDAGKDWWDTAVLVCSTSKTFTKSHVRMLEFLSIERAKEAGRFRVENGNGGTRPHLPEPLESEVAEIFETMGLLLGTLGFPVFEDQGGAARASTTTDTLVFQYKGDGFHGRGRYVDGEFIVLKDSIARLKVTDSSKEWLPPRREALEREGVIEKTNTGWVFRTDRTFPSPSYAAAMIYGGSANGWQYWKLPDGRTLSDVYRGDDA
jgi:Domain of unknown function (DUF4357)